MCYLSWRGRRSAYTQEEIYASVAKQEPQLEKWELEVVGSDADQTALR